MIDSHAHYSYFKFENTFRYLSYLDGGYKIIEGDRQSVFREMKSLGIDGFVEPGIDVDSNYKIMDLYKDNRGVMYPAVGVHPTRTFLAPWKRRKELDELAEKDGKISKRIRNSSPVILAVADEIARIKKVYVAHVLRVTTDNTKKLFGIKGL